MSGDQQLPVLALLQDQIGGGDLDSLDPELFLFPDRSAFSHPVAKGRVIGGLSREAAASAMRDLERRFLKQQARFRIFRFHSRPDRFRALGRQDLVGASLHDPSVVFPGMPGIQRELEAAASLDAAVTGRIVAAPPGEDAADLSGETERSRCPALAHLDRGLGNLTLEFRPDCRIPVVAGDELPFGAHIGDVAVVHLQVGVGGDVPLVSVGECRDHHQPLRGAGAPHANLLGHQAQRQSLRRMSRRGSRRSRKQQRTGKSQDNGHRCPGPSPGPGCPLGRRRHCSYSFLPSAAAAL